MFNIGDFRSVIEKDGFLRPALYRIYTGVPKILSGQTIVNQKSLDNNYDTRFKPGTRDLAEMLAFRAHHFREPGVNLMTYDVPRYGFGLFEKRVYNAQYTDTTISFLCDRNNKVWNYWNSWTNGIFNHSPGMMDNFEHPRMTLSYKDDYVSTIFIQKFDETGDTVAVFQLNRAHPVFINDQEIGWDMSNQICIVTVGISFQTWDSGTKLSPGFPRTEETQTTSQSPAPPGFSSLPPKTLG